MSIDKINKSIYSNSDSIRSYANTTLQPPEVSIFVKYKDFYYDAHILDVGCGAGRTSFYFRNFTNKYTGIDYSKGMIDFCQNQHPELSFQHCDARDLSHFDDNSFDFIIFSYNGIDYITHADRLIVLKEIHRILKKDGLFVFSTHNRNHSTIITKPKLEPSLNPVRLLRNSVHFLKENFNSRKLKSKQVEKNDYAIINDSGNHFSLLTYYITKEKQIEQLNNCGFSLLEMFDMHGQTLDLNADDAENTWIYFVSQK